MLDDFSETVTVSAPGMDPVSVSGVLVAPGDAATVNAEGRFDSALVAYTLYWPKDAPTKDLYGADIAVRGETFHVTGDPKPWSDGCPGAWDMVVKVAGVYG